MSIEPVVPQELKPRLLSIAGYAWQFLRKLPPEYLYPLPSIIFSVDHSAVFPAKSQILFTAVSFVGVVSAPVSNCILFNPPSISEIIEVYFAVFVERSHNQKISRNVNENKDYSRYK